MNTAEILCSVLCDPLMNSRVLGVYSADSLPIRVNKTGLVVNTDDSNKAGKHWIAFYFADHGVIEVFDSYGNPAEIYNKYFTDYLRNNAVCVKYNKTKLQSSFSDVCGQYCLYFLMNRIRNISLDDIVSNFKNIPNNDAYVAKSIASAFPFCAPRKCKNNQICLPLNMYHLD